MSSRLLHCSVFSLTLGLVLSSPGRANASVVTSSASMLIGLYPSYFCVNSQTSNGSVTASASALCERNGIRGSAFGSASFQSLALNSLVVNSRSLSGPGDIDVHGGASASWAEYLVAKGGTGSGVLLFNFTGQGSISGMDAKCSLQLRGKATTTFCQGYTDYLPFTFGASFGYSVLLNGSTWEPNGETFPQQKLSTVDMAVTLQSIEVRYQNPNGSPGDVIPGAFVEVAPEPQALYLVVAGLLWCAARYSRKSGRFISH